MTTETAATTISRGPFALGSLSDNEAAELLAESLGLQPGEAPFPWQTRLLRQLRQGDFPRSLDIPTGLGKTATIAIWLLARSLGAPVPRRLIYVVDRRVVVDQATAVADRLRDWVSTRPAIQEGLALDGRQLPVSTLRGKHVDNREWLEDPSTPAILVGTVDMIGSRLLFEGYRASRKIRPYMAGLLGHDSLFVLDEAHLVPPFERLLERIALDPADLAASPVAKHFEPPLPRLLSLSATGRSRGGVPFGLDDSDLAHPVVKQRLDARKRLTVEVLDGKTALPICAAERAWEIADEGRRPIRCVIFLTKRDDAEKARDHLAKLAGLDKPKKGQQTAANLELLVGGRRVFERAEAARRLEGMGFLAGSSPDSQHPAFLIATSAGEVGVDLDADHMVCDLVAWERTIQRLGRVNRRGLGDAQVVVLDGPAKDKVSTEQQERLEAARAVIARLPLSEDGTRHANAAALRELQRASRDDGELAAQIAQASTPDPPYPALDRPTLDAWSMTSLPDHSGRPSVAPWLRGWIEDRPQTVVVWRRLLPIPVGRVPSDSETKRFFEAAPAHLSEQLEAETFHVSEWLIKRAKKLLTDASKRREDNDGFGRDTPVALTLSVGDESYRWWTLQQLTETKKSTLERALENTMLLVDARLGGLSHGLLDATADDVPATLDGPSWSEVPYRIRETRDADAIKDPSWRERERVPVERTANGEPTRWLVVEKIRHEATTEEDRSAGRPQRLAEHQSCAAAHASRLAQRLGLSKNAERVLVVSARLHDEGKRASRWQLAFNAQTDGPYAKTRGPVNVHLLDGYRHEFGSLPYAERDAEVAALPDDDRDLVLHLIASHHGFARPNISTRGCDNAPPSALESRARAVALRFARLQQRWGPWGLAWWEALLRAADQQASRENDLQDTASAASESR